MRVLSIKYHTNPSCSDAFWLLRTDSVSVPQVLRESFPQGIPTAIGSSKTRS